MTTIKNLEQIPFDFITDINENDILQHTNISKKDLLSLVSQRITHKLSAMAENKYVITDVPFVLNQIYTEDSEKNVLEFFNVALQNTTEDAYFYLVVTRAYSSGVCNIKLNNVFIIIKGLYIESGVEQNHHYIVEEGCYLVYRKNGEYFYQIPLQKKARYYTFGQDYKYILKNTVDTNTQATKYGHFLYTQYFFNNSIGAFSPVAMINTAQSYQIPDFETFSHYSETIFLYLDNSSLGTYYTIPNTHNMYASNTLNNPATYVSSEATPYLIPQSIQLLEVYYE